MSDTTIRPAKPSSFTPPAGLVQAGVVILLFCMAFFAFDAFEDLLKDAEAGFHYSFGELLHMTLEILSVLGMGFAAYVLRAYVVHLRQQSLDTAQTISLLRGEFQNVVQAKFDVWNLTPAERDVTMLILKGLSISQIANARNTAPGTIKAQSTAIFRKTGVASKSELLSLFMDEFLDSAQSG